MDTLTKEPEIIKPPLLVAAEFTRLADKTFKNLVRLNNHRRE